MVKTMVTGSKRTASFIFSLLERTRATMQIEPVVKIQLIRNKHIVIACANCDLFTSI